MIRSYQCQLFCHLEFWKSEFGKIYCLQHVRNWDNNVFRLKPCLYLKKVLSKVHPSINVGGSEWNLHINELSSIYILLPNIHFNKFNWHLWLILKISFIVIVKFWPNFCCQVCVCVCVCLCEGSCHIALFNGMGMVFSRWHIYWRAEWIGWISSRDAVWSDTCSVHTHQQGNGRNGKFLSQFILTLFVSYVSGWVKHS